MESTLPQTASTALINISLAWIVGILASRFWLMRQTAAWQGTAVKRLSAAMPAALVACAASVFLSLWTESAAMGGVAWLDAWPACVEMMTSTHYGHAGVASLALLALALAAHRVLDRPGGGARYLAGMSALVLLLAAARVTIGHAFGHGPFSLAVWTEWLHLLLMALWTGVVFVAGWVVLPRALATDPAAARERASYLRSMSDWASAALAGILATGAYNAWRVLGSPRDLVDLEYGHVLVFKLCFVMLAVALGGFNKFVGLPASLAARTPSASVQAGLRRVVTILRLESIALLLVLIAAAVLANNAPPAP